MGEERHLRRLRRMFRVEFDLEVERPVLVRFFVLSVVWLALVNSHSRLTG